VPSEGVICNNFHCLRFKSQVGFALYYLQPDECSLFGCSIQFSLSRARSIQLPEIEDDRHFQYYVEEWVSVFVERCSSYVAHPLLFLSSIPVAQTLCHFKSPVPAIPSSRQP
jgi:hypothetical protein